MEVSWAGFAELAGVLRDKLAAEDLRDPVLYGVERGGVVPAVCLSHWLGAPFRSLRRGGAPRGEAGRDVVVVDDILDTGETYRRLGGGAARYAVLLSRAAPPNVVYGGLHSGGWVAFPWERPPPDGARHPARPAASSTARARL